MSKTRTAIPLVLLATGVLLVALVAGTSSAGAATADPLKSWSSCMKKHGVKITAPKGQRPSGTPSAMPTPTGTPAARPSGQPPAGGPSAATNRPAGVSAAKWKKAVAACASKLPTRPSDGASPAAT